ncbi:MAG: glutamine synthetase, partial [Cyanobacteria bacterium J06635_1]
MTGVLTRVETSTDLEAYVQAEGRAELVKQVRAKINELGVQYIYYQFISITGKITGKGVPADHWESMAAKGIQLVYGATVNLAINRNQQYLGYGPESAELVAIP